MSEAPERIWVKTRGVPKYYEFPCEDLPLLVEYVRADRIEELAATNKELEATLEKAEKIIAAAKEMYETAMLTGGGSPVAWADHVRARNAFASTLAELKGQGDE